MYKAGRMRAAPWHAKWGLRAVGGVREWAAKKAARRRGMGRPARDGAGTWVNGARGQGEPGAKENPLDKSNRASSSMKRLRLSAERKPRAEQSSQSRPPVGIRGSHAFGGEGRAECERGWLGLGQVGLPQRSVGEVDPRGVQPAQVPALARCSKRDPHARRPARLGCGLRGRDGQRDEGLTPQAPVGPDCVLHHHHPVPRACSRQ
eukprot:scaffold2123_cov111-Isochrysis_galbana.AAC.4